MSTGAKPHFLHVFSTFVPAGPQVRTAKLLAAWKDDFRHSIVAMDGRTEARELIPGDVEVRYVDPPPKAGTLATVPRLRKLIGREQPDLVLTYNFGAFDAVIAARTLGFRRVVHHEDGFHPDETEQFKRRRVWARRALLPGVFRVIVISDTLRKIALQTWKQAPLHVTFIPNGIDLEHFPERDGNPAMRAELGIPPDAVVVGAVGHLRPEKNLPRLFAAAARVAPAADVRLLILGDGPERAKLEQLATVPPLAGRVHFVGYHADPRAHYRAMDVFALTSDTEQMPIALLEAMACKLPVLATNVGDVMAMLSGEQAPFVVLPGGDPCADALASALARLASDAALRRRIGDLNHLRAKKFFSQRAMIDAYAEVYRAALKA